MQYKFCPSLKSRSILKEMTTSFMVVNSFVVSRVDKVDRLRVFKYEKQSKFWNDQAFFGTLYREMHLVFKVFEFVILDGIKLCYLIDIWFLQLNIT